MSEEKKENGLSSSPSPPGAGASTVHGVRIWDLLWSSMVSRRSRLRFTWIAARSNSASKKAAPWQVWPMPLPYPEIHKSKVDRRRDVFSKKLGVNYIVVVMNFLQGQGQHWKATSPGLGTPLNSEQWRVAMKIEEHVVAWNAEEPTTATDMGRAASKVQSVEELLHAISFEIRRRSLQR